MAKKGAAATTHRRLFFKVREPMRRAVWTTMTVTAGLKP